MLKDYFKIALANLMHRKIRSGLTVLGIVIGVAAIIALITVSQGLDSSIKEQLGKFGADRITVFPGGVGDPSFRSSDLNEQDRDKVESISDYEYVAAWLTKNVVVEFSDQKIVSNVIGWDNSLSKELERDYDMSFHQGRGLLISDKFSAVIGPKAAEDLFDKQIRLRNTIEVAGTKFKVIGIFKSFGNPDDDNRIYIPIDVLRDLTNSPEEITFLDGKIKPTSDIEVVAAKTQRALEKIRDEEEFEVTTFEQLLGQINTILGIIQAVLIGIAGISIVVGGIGIMNSMYTSVLERTREIGIMKAIGAKNSNIVAFFLVESALQGAFGGVLGVIIGAGIAKGVAVFAQQGGFGFLEISITPGIVAFGIFFAVGVGMISGAFPAKQAAKMQPVDALRK